MSASKPLKDINMDFAVVSVTQFIIQLRLPSDISIMKRVHKIMKFYDWTSTNRFFPKDKPFEFHSFHS